MIFKLTKVNFTHTDFKSNNDHSNKNGQSEFANHLYYLVSNKKTGLYDPNRSDLIIKLNPEVPDFQETLRKIGPSLSKNELKELCHLEAEKHKSYILSYVEKSNLKSRHLDENGETYNRRELYNQKINLTYQNHEFMKMLNHYNGDIEKVKKLQHKMKCEILCIFYNNFKKEHYGGKKFVKTEIHHIEGYDNFHIKGEKNPHIHSFTHPFDPATGLFVNPRQWALSKQKAHNMLEKMYPQFLDQNISLGYDAIEAIKARQDFSNTYTDPKEEAKDFKKLELTIDKVLSLGNRNTTELTKIFEKNGVIITKANEKAINFRLKDSDIIFNEKVFSDTNIRRKLKTFGERASLDKRPVYTTDKLEIVLKKEYDTVIQSLNSKLSTSLKDTHKAIKFEAFKEFARRLETEGLYVDINSKGHASYLKLGLLDMSKKKGTPLFKYKSSLMLNQELKGFNLLKTFDLNEEDILAYKLEHLNHISNQINYRDVIYIKNLDLEYNDFNKSLFLINFQESFLNRRGYKSLYKDNEFYFVGKNDDVLLKMSEKDKNGVRKVTFSSVNPKEAAELLYLISIEAAKSASKDNNIEITPNPTEDNYAAYKFLKAKLLLSNDINAKKIIINIDKLDDDAEFKQILKQEIDKKIDYYNKYFNKSVASIRNDKFNFTENSCFSLIGKVGLEDFDEVNKRQVNETIVKLVIQHNVKQITFNKVDDYKYIIENKEELLDLCKNYNQEQIDKINQLIKDAEIKNQKQSVKIEDDYDYEFEDPKIKNKNKNKRSR